VGFAAERSWVGYKFHLLHASIIGAALAYFCLSATAFSDPRIPLAMSDPITDQSNSAQNANYNDGDFTRPETSATLRLQFRKSSGATTSSDREQEILQYSSRLKLGDDWTIGTQIQIPITEKRTFPDQSEPENATGLAGTILQGALIRSIGTRWAYGFGARLVTLPTAESVAADRWQIMPAAGIRYSFLDANSDTYFVPVVRYAISFGGNPTARTIREPQIAPTFNIGLPDRWFVTLYPSNDIRINFGTPVSGQTGRLFLPFDAAIGKKIADNFVVSLEGSVPIVKDYPVYDFKTELKATWNF
jgi:hypothetical protein